MDFFGLLFGSSTAQSKISGLYSLEMDALMEETQEWSSDVTANPVENGVEISDHIRNSPDTVTITGMVGNVDMRGRFPSLISGQISGLIDGVGGVDRLLTAFDILRSIHTSRSVVTLYTKWHTYENMALVSVSIPRTASIGQAVQFTLVFKSIRIVSSMTAEVPSGIGRTSSVSKKVSQQKKVGAVETKEKQIANVSVTNTSVIKGILSKTRTALQ